MTGEQYTLTKDETFVPLAESKMRWSKGQSFPGPLFPGQGNQLLLTQKESSTTKLPAF